jgi:hypothetical protein
LREGDGLILLGQNRLDLLAAAAARNDKETTMIRTLGTLPPA